MTDFLEMANCGQHGQHLFHDHADVPGTTRTDLHVRRVARLGMKVGIGEDDHLISELGDQGVKDRVVDIGRIAVPPHDQADMIEDEGQFATDDPAMSRYAFLTDLLRAAPFTHLLVFKHLNPLCVHYHPDWQALVFSSEYLFLRRAFGRSVITEALPPDQLLYLDADHLPEVENSYLRCIYETMYPGC